MSIATLTKRVDTLEHRMTDAESRLDSLTINHNAHWELTGKVMKNLTKLMAAQGLEVEELTEEEIDDLHDA